jgi:hypothetical protein
LWFVLLIVKDKQLFSIGSGLVLTFLDLEQFNWNAELLRDLVQSEFPRLSPSQEFGLGQLFTLDIPQLGAIRPFNCWSI